MDELAAAAAAVQDGDVPNLPVSHILTSIHHATARSSRRTAAAAAQPLVLDERDALPPDVFGVMAQLSEEDSQKLQSYTVRSTEGGVYKLRGKACSSLHALCAAAQDDTVKKYGGCIALTTERLAQPVVSNIDMPGWLGTLCNGPAGLQLSGCR